MSDVKEWGTGYLFDEINECMGINGGREFMSREIERRMTKLEVDLAAQKSINEAITLVNETLNRQLDEANGKLRWRKWPDEKPMGEGWYLCDVDGGQHTTLFYYPKTGAWHLDGLRELPKTSRLNSWLPIPSRKMKE